MGRPADARRSRVPVACGVMDGPRLSAVPLSADDAVAAPVVADLRRGNFDALLSVAERNELHALGVVRHFPRGALLMLEREPGERVMIGLVGRAKVSRVRDDGREVILSIRDPGDLLGELSFIDGEPRLTTVVAPAPIWSAARTSPSCCCRS